MHEGTVGTGLGRGSGSDRLSMAEWPDGPTISEEAEPTSAGRLGWSRSQRQALVCHLLTISDTLHVRVSARPGRHSV
jgi:hypothetical protein